MGSVMPSLLRVHVLLLCATAHGLDNGVAVTPPMGFNSYMAPQSGATGLGEIASFFINSGMVHSGYEYINTDEGWELKGRDPATGKLQWNGAYPDGIKGFTDKLKTMGLKYGIYGANSGVTCGVNPGQLYHEDIDAQTYVDWGVSYVKSDNCASYAMDPSVRFGAMRDALNRTGERVVLSIEPFSITPDPEQSVRVSNLWRIACDISGNYDDVLNRADISDKWSPLAGPGGWNDPDMINLRNPPSRGSRNESSNRSSDRSDDGETSDGGTTRTASLGENRVYFGLWAIMKAPLLLSADLPNLIPDLIAIANNTEIIAVNQDPLGVQARKLARSSPSTDGTAGGSALGAGGAGGAGGGMAMIPWLVGTSSCSSRPSRSYSRSMRSSAGKGGKGKKEKKGGKGNHNDSDDDDDTRKWTVTPAATVPSTVPADSTAGSRVGVGNASTAYVIHNTAAGRCLTASGQDGTKPGTGAGYDAVVLLPCDNANTGQVHMKRREEETR